MNSFDLIIILLVVAAVFRGMRFGLLQLLLSSVGFFVGITLGFLVARLGALHLSSQNNRAFLVIAVILVFVLGFSTLGEILGNKLAKKTHGWHLDEVNRVLGSVFEVATVLILVWLVASGLSNVQSYDIGRSIHGSVIIRRLDNVLPTPPDFLAQLEKVITPNGFPKVFVGNEPEHTTVKASPGVDTAKVMAAKRSVVKVEGKGCGGIVEGSGFVIDKELVITNAHVIAGVLRPTVVDQTGVSPATAVWFDPNLDVAVLRVTGLTDPPLTMATDQLARGDGAVILGFPGGGPMTANKAVVLDQLKAVGRNIYNRGLVSRYIYELQTDIEPGNSGGPVIEADGSVAAVVFAKGISQPNIGYALLINQVKDILGKAKTHGPVGVGNCAAN